MAKAKKSTNPSLWQEFAKGVTTENPLLVSMLGMCPLLAITTSVENALGMGMAIMLVLVMSNLIISLIRNIVPDEIRIPVYIVVIATFTTIVDMLMAAFVPALHSTLGIFIPLIVVNCIILGRAEAFASKNGPLRSIFDGLGMAVGATAVLAMVSLIREFLGTGTITIWKGVSLDIASSSDIFTDFFVSPAGAFIVLAFVFATVAAIKSCRAKKAERAKQARIEELKKQKALRDQAKLEEGAAQ